MLELPGAITRLLTAMLGRKSAIGRQVRPASFDFHTPPATPAANIKFGWRRSMTRARVRPPILPGPSGSHVEVVESAPSRLTAPVPPPAAREGSARRPTDERCGMVLITFAASR